MDAKLTKLENAWIKLDNKYHIIRSIEKDGVYEISAKAIKEFREPRLMTKFDNTAQRPILLSDHELSILPNTRGTYLISDFVAYKALDDVAKPFTAPTSKTIPQWITSMNVSNISSESVALAVAHISGMIDDVLQVQGTAPKSLYTVNGRMKTGIFDFEIERKNQSNFMFSVNNSQMEIDGAYESFDKIGIVEAKQFIPQNFLVRQLYFPYRMLINQSPSKRVVPIFFTYSDDIFSFFIYEFLDPRNYSSIKLVGRKDFVLNRALDIQFSDVRDYALNSPKKEEPNGVPFPQADNFGRVLSLLNFLKTKPRELSSITAHFGFDARQSNYYTSALRYLGLSEKNKLIHRLTPLGNNIAAMSNDNNRNWLIIKLILDSKVFSTAFDSYLNNGRKRTTKYMANISQLIFDQSPEVDSMVTAKRRSSTVASWIEWIVSVTNEN